MVKIIVDYSVAIFSLFLLMPVIVVLSILIKLSGNGPVIYSQKRVGKSGKSFIIYKFRSMYVTSENGLKLISGSSDKRITPLGRFMRKHKLDEIPNFINVLKGDMSIVGPRPEQQYFIDQMVTKVPQYRHLEVIKPGITSWGQVKYGYASNVDEMIKRLEYDLYYLNNRSLWFDFKIACHTVGIILKGQGI